MACRACGRCARDEMTHACVYELLPACDALHCTALYCRDIRPGPKLTGRAPTTGASARRSSAARCVLEPGRRLELGARGLVRSALPSEQCHAWEGDSAQGLTSVQQVGRLSFSAPSLAVRQRHMP